MRYLLVLYSPGCTNLGSDGGTNQPQSAHLSSWRKPLSCLSDHVQRHPHILDNVINQHAVLPSCKPMLSTVSIMPGIETLAPERHEKNNGLFGSPNLRPGRSIAMHEAIRGKLHVTSHAICHVRTGGVFNASEGLQYFLPHACSAPYPRVDMRRQLSHSA